GKAMAEHFHPTKKMKELDMRVLAKCLVAVMTCGVAFLGAVAQCPPRPQPGTVVQDPYSISSQNGVLSAEMILGHSVDDGGYTHYCYNYKTPDNKIAESPTLRLNQGDELKLDILNRIKDDNPMKMKMPMDAQVCGSGGEMTISSTKVHFHGLNVPPKCHQDDVINTVIQPGDPAFPFRLQIPPNEPPGLYWYHPHIHGFTEFQVNGGAAGALIVEGMEKYRPEVAGLTERIFTIRQQFLVPWVPGPYQLTINFQQACIVQGPCPRVLMKPGEKQFWRVLNASIQDFMPLQVTFNGVAQPLQVIALDGYPLAQTRNETTILVPPAGRAEFIVSAPP